MNPVSMRTLGDARGALFLLSAFAQTTIEEQQANAPLDAYHMIAGRAYSRRRSDDEPLPDELAEALQRFCAAFAEEYGEAGRDILHEFRACALLDGCAYCERGETHSIDDDAWIDPDDDETWSAFVRSLRGGGWLFKDE